MQEETLASWRHRNPTVWAVSCTVPQWASVLGKPPCSIQHGMGWEPQRGYSWIQHSIHPLQISTALSTSLICFFLSLRHEKVSWAGKKLIGCSLLWQILNKSGDTASPNRLQSTGQLVTFLQAGKNICLDVQTVLDSSLTSLSAIRALTGK